MLQLSTSEYLSILLASSFVVLSLFFLFFFLSFSVSLCPLCGCVLGVDILTCILLQEGTAAIYDHYSEGKSLSRDMVAILTARTAAEERYAKELAAIAAKANTLTDTESTLPAAWISLRDAHAARAEIHSTLAKKIHLEAIKVMTDDIRDRSQRKGDLFEEDKSLHNQLNKHRSATESALQRYMSAAAAAEAAKKQFDFAQQDANMPPKKLKALETQEAKLAAEADKAHDAYKQHLAELNAYQKTYETGLGALLCSLQEMEEERSAKIHDVLKVYLEAHQTMAREETSLNTAAAEVVGKIAPAADLQAWISSHATGLEPEALIEYEAYEPQFENATPEDVMKPAKVGRQFSKHTLRKTGGNNKAAEDPAAGGKKLQRQKSLSRLLGNKSKGVSKGGSGEPKKSIGSPDGKDSLQASGKSVNIVVAPVSSSPASPTSGTGMVKKGPKGRRAKAMFEFAASDDTEISFKVGDIIIVVREDDSGWWDCEKDGMIGLAPGNYLQFLDDEVPANAGTPAPASKSEPTKSEPKAQTPPAAAEEVEDTLPPETMEFETTSLPAPTEPAPVSPRPVQKSQPAAAAAVGAEEEEEEEEAEPIGRVTALYDFAGDGEDELPVKVGEEIEVYAEVEGWYTGTNAAGQYGLLPINFCSEMRPL